MAKIKLDKYIDNDQYAFNLETLIILLKAIERKFHDQGYAVDNEVEIDVPADEVVAEIEKKINEGEDESN